MALLAVLWPLAHLTLMIFLIGGGPLGVHRPWVARVHLAAAAATGAVFLLGADCPLTTWEKQARSAAGWPGYRGGFIEHYLVRPLHPSGITTAITVLIVAAWVVPSIAGHAVRRHRTRRPTVATGRCGPAGGAPAGEASEGVSPAR